MAENLDVMFASHQIAASKLPGEYRVVLIGDSSVWGESLAVQDSISAQWNQISSPCNNRQIKFYNLGYPYPSVMKDLLILDKAMDYRPDMVLWFITSNTLIPRRQNPLLAANRERAMRLLDDFDMGLSEEDQIALAAPSSYEKTLSGRRTSLNRAIKLQALGFIWMLSGQDALTSRPSQLRSDVDADLKYRGFKPNNDLRDEMMFDALHTGYVLAQSIPILIVNETIFIAAGHNSDFRYNYIYPRWAYDQYREALTVEALNAHWNFLDLWDTIPTDHFSDTGLHLSSEGERMLIIHIDPAVRAIACS
jgi:hypothetical protein